MQGSFFVVSNPASVIAIKLSRTNVPEATPPIARAGGTP
jgi:hypothetical protein